MEDHATDRGVPTLERHAQRAVVRLLDQTPQRRQQRLETLLEERAELHDHLKRTLWQRRVDARNAHRLACTEDRIPAISRWRAEAIEAAHKELFLAESRAAQKRFGFRASREEAQARSRLAELLRLAGCATYDDFCRRIEVQQGLGREEREAEARVELEAADRAWREFEDGLHPDLVALDEEIARLRAHAN